MGNGHEPTKPPTKPGTGTGTGTSTGGGKTSTGTKPPGGGGSGGTESPDSIVNRPLQALVHRAVRTAGAVGFPPSCAAHLCR